MSSHLRKEILAACAAGDLARVQELYHQILSTSNEHVPLPEMTLKAAEKGHSEIVRFCLERGVKLNYEVIIEALEFPKCSRSWSHSEV
jgi:hypothetical protein